MHSKTIWLKWCNYPCETYPKVTERHLPYEITQCYLPPNIREFTLPESQPERPVLDLLTPEE